MAGLGLGVVLRLGLGFGLINKDNNLSCMISTIYLADYSGIIPIESDLYRVSCSKLVITVVSFMFNLNEASHSYNTRLSDTNFLYAKSDVAFFKSYIFNSCRIWKYIPIIFRNANCLISFSKLYYSHLLDTW